MNDRSVMSAEGFSAAGERMVAVCKSVTRGKGGADQSV